MERTDAAMPLPASGASLANVGGCGQMEMGTVDIGREKLYIDVLVLPPDISPGFYSDD